MILKKYFHPRVAYLIEGLFQHRRTMRKKMKSLYSQFISKGDLVFDVGANYGEHTAIFLELGARVVSIEPQKECARYLKKLFPKIGVENIALGKQNGTAQLKICSSMPSIASIKESVFSHVPKKYRWNKVEMVSVTTLDSMIAKYGKPDFIKIDVDGFEEEVLQGLSVNVDALSFEYIADDWQSAQKCIKLLEGYSFNHSIREEFLLHDWHDGKFSEIKSWGDIYAKKKRSASWQQ